MGIKDVVKEKYGQELQPVHGVHFLRKPCRDPGSLQQVIPSQKYPADALEFMMAQLAGAAARTVLSRPSLPKDAGSVVVSHPAQTETNL